MRAVIAIVAFALGSLLAFDAWSIYDHVTTTVSPSGVPAEYVGHLIFIAGIAFDPTHLIAGLAVAAVLLWGGGIFLLLAGHNETTQT
jgi:hypothetical protein